MPTTEVAVTPAWASLQAGPETVKVQRRTEDAMILRLAATGAQTGDEGIVIEDNRIEQFVVPTGQSLYGRTVTAANGKITVVGTELAPT